MAIALCLVRRTGSSYRLRKFGLQQEFRQLPRPERDVSSEDFRAIIAGQASGRDLRGDAICVQLDGSRHIHRAVGNEYRLFGQTWKVGKEVGGYRNRSMRLATKHSNPTRQLYIGTLAIGTAEGVAGQGARCRFGPGHDHTTVQTTGQRHGNRIGPAEVFGKDSSKCLLQAGIEFHLAHRRLSFPRLRTEVRSFADVSVRTEGPT